MNRTATTVRMHAKRPVERSKGMVTLTIDVSSYPAEREDLGLFNHTISIEYSRDTGTIESAYAVEYYAKGTQYGTRHVEIHTSLAWSLIGGRSELAREYLDDLADRVVYQEGAAQ